MRVAIVHDDLVQWGGAERVLEVICEIYPEAPIYTSIFDIDNSVLQRIFGSKTIITSFLQKIPGWRNLYKILLPLYPIAFEQFDFSRFDLVISHTTRFAKSIITKPSTIHISYCHTPPRFLWHFSGEGNLGFGEILMSKLRIYDQISARRVDHFIAGSENAKRRIKRVYRVDSKVVYPFIDLNRFKGIETFDGGYFLVISRLNRYKRVDLAVEACIKLGIQLKVIGTGPEMDNLKRLPRRFAPRNDVNFLGNIDDELVVQVLAGARALIIPGIEDFGLTALEAQALGKPVIAYKADGVLETVIDGTTGVFFDQQSVESLKDVLVRFNHLNWNEQNLKKNAGKFSKDNFIQNFRRTINCLVY